MAVVNDNLKIIQKTKVRLPDLIRKHLLNKKQKLDMLFLAGVLNMEAKLTEEIFYRPYATVLLESKEKDGQKEEVSVFKGRVTDANHNLGNKYMSSGINIWSNAYYKERFGK